MTINDQSGQDSMDTDFTNSQDVIQMRSIAQWISANTALVHSSDISRPPVREVLSSSIA